MNMALSHLFLVIHGWWHWVARHCLREPRSLVGVRVHRHTKTRTRDWECCNCRKPPTRQNNLPLLQLELNIFKSQDLLLHEISPCLHWPCGVYYKLVQHIFSLVATHRTFDVVMAKPKLVVHIVDGVTLFLQSFASWNMSAMFFSANFCIAQSTCIGL